MGYPLGHVYDALYAYKDYSGESARITELIRARNPSAQVHLEVACGTGKHVDCLRVELGVEGLDLDTNVTSDEMRAAFERAGLEVEHGPSGLIGRRFFIGRVP